MADALTWSVLNTFEPNEFGFGDCVNGFGPYEAPGNLSTENDMVDHPDHYRSGGMEAIDVIEAFGLGFNLGNAVKYVLRAGRKLNRREDLEKALWYIRRELGKGVSENGVQRR